MEYCRVINGEIVKWLSSRPKGGIDKYSTIGADMPDSDLIALGILPVERDQQPDAHKMQYIEEVITIEETRVIVTYNLINKSIQEKIDALALSARRHREHFVEGSASGAITDGFIKGLTICTAVMEWQEMINNEYLARKDAITENSDVNLDFSMFPPPYTVWEALNEWKASLVI